MLEYNPLHKHTCLFYNSKEELLDILVPYFKAGLESDEFCLWIVSEPLNPEEAKSALKKTVNDPDSYIKKGQLEIGGFKDYYFKSGVFTSAGMLEYWNKKKKEVLDQGFKSIRISGDGSWALADEYWLNLRLYEEEINKTMEDFQGMSICTYCVSKLQLNQILDLGAFHQSSLCRRMGRWDSIPSSNFCQAKDKLA
ncbi:MAG: MEDS domain-containing protein [Candidatus Omnitrophota bacterium]